MRKNITCQLLITLISISLFILPLTAHTAIPQKINFQGYLTDPHGISIDNAVSIVFSIYSHPTGGTALWTETQTVTVTDGVFSTNLGSTNPINLAFDTTYYLGITVGSDSEMSPRQPITSVGYAFRAKEADSVKDNAVTNTVLADDAVTTDKIADDAISGDKIAPATITSTNIANGAVESTQIGDASVGTQDLADDAVTAVKIKPSIISSINGVTNDGGNVDLVAGTNITITPDDATDKITISSSGGAAGSVWTESGGDVYRDSGNVGIGTTNPNNKLEVNGYTVIGSNSKGIRMRTDGAFVDMESPQTPLAINYGTGNSTLLNVIGGNVGIGTSIPEEKLHVVGASRFEVGGGSISFSTPGGWPGIIAFSKNGHRRDIHLFDNFINISLSGSDKAPALSNGIAILEDGNVGIGITNPDTRLAVIDQYDAIKGISDKGTGVYGEHKDSGNYGELGNSFCGVYGYHQDSLNNGRLGTKDCGVVGMSTNNTGVIGSSVNSIGVNGYSLYNYAGYFEGKVKITGNLEKPAGQFKIDHPLDPENKYLSHSFVESPDMMNVYNGNVVLDENGEAWVELPEWFEALNKEFRYQLTPIGEPGPNLYIAQKISDNHFKIEGGSPYMEVSWQVTGIRHDPYAEAHTIKVEENKPPEEQGYYLHPELYGQTEGRGIDSVRNPKMMQKIKEARKTKAESNS